LKEITAEDSSEGKPIARLTPLGWTCIGPVMGDWHEEGNCVNFTYHLHTVVEKENKLKEMVKKIWELDAIGLGRNEKQIRPQLTPEELKAEQKVLGSMKMV
jgi:hypothetical protein